MPFAPPSPESGGPTLPGDQPAPHVRGGGVYRRTATFGLRLGSLVVDGAVVLALFFILHRAASLSPVPEPWWVAAWIVGLGGSWALHRAWLGRTPGNAVWRLRGARPGLMEPLLRPTSLTGTERAAAVLLTAAAVLACAWSIDQAVFKQPMWARAERLELEAYLPDMASGEWQVLPFFYSMGAWPRSYHGRPVFYSLPYEKGPPNQFIGHLTARWDDPGTLVTFEGPKTPLVPVTSGRPGDRSPRERIRDCLLGESHSWGCLKIREATLARHLADMELRLAGRATGDTALKMHWSLRWFRVENRALAPAEQAQGIYLEAQDERGTRGEERYVLITENGTHQALWLDYANPGTTEAELARRTFGQAVRSLRASDDLGQGREWVEHQLKGVSLTGLAGPGGEPARADPASITRLADAQSLLVAQITVQPAMLDTYFYLGSTALLLGRISRRGPNAGHLEGLELAAVAKPLIQSAYRYAQDVGPEDAMTTQLQGFLLEAQKP